MMNWYHLNEDGNLVKSYMVDIAFKAGEMVPTEPLIEAEDWEGMAALGWYREYLEPHIPYRDGYRGPVIAPHPADGFPCAFTAAGERYAIEELRAIKAREVTSQIPQHTGTELASDFRLELRVVDVVTWASKVYARIAATEDWDAVADIDTSLPDPLGLTQEEVAKAIRKQVEIILIRDTIRIPLGYGMPTAHREELQKYLKVLGTCANAPDGIPPPPAGFRQRVYVPDESNFSVLLSRFPEGGGFWWHANIVSDDSDLEIWVAEYNVFFARVNPLKKMSGSNTLESRGTAAQFVGIRVGSSECKVTGLIELPPVGSPALLTIYYGGSVNL